MKSNSNNTNDENIRLKKENEELKTRLSINQKIIKEFFKNSNIDEKATIFVENIKRENKILLSKIENLKKENEKLSTIYSKNNPIEVYENKLFVYENLLKEKQSIIVNLKAQNQNLKQMFESKLTKEKTKIEKEKPKLNDNNINNNENKEIIDNNFNNECFVEEVYITSPHKIVNTLNNKIELYKSVNQKLKYLINQLKTNLSNKEKEYIKLEEEALKIKEELQKYNQMKNNEDIINQLIQYQSMKSLPVSQSCSNFKVQNNEFNKNKANTRNKKTKSSSNISIYSNNNNIDNNKEKIMKEIERYENINKAVKEISNNDFDLAGEWAETLKHCGMTQEEFLRFCELKITNKLTNAIEYLYKILIDKNIQIKLLMKENEALNEENIRLNKINIEMESSVEFYQKNKNNERSNKKVTRTNSFFDDYKNKFLNERSKNKNTFNNSSSHNELQSTFVNVDNNITHTNININMMMDYDHLNDINKNSITSSEFREGLLLNDINQKKDKKIINNDKGINIQKYNLVEPKKFNKSKDKVLRYLKLNKRKINNRSYNKLIIDRKNDLNEKTQNVSAIKKSCKNFDNINEYNRTIKNIFNNTEKIQIRNIKKNIKSNFITKDNKEKRINKINLNPGIIMNNLKLIQKNQYKRNETNYNSHDKNCKSENNKFIKIFKKHIKIKLNK